MSISVSTSATLKPHLRFILGSLDSGIKLWEILNGENFRQDYSYGITKLSVK
jgi:hypothetical protein